MTDPAIILGTFADFKTVKTRSVVQIIVEVPIERGKQVVEAFGFPQPGAEIPVAVTRFVEDAVPVQPEPEKPTRPGRPFADMPPSQQAGMLCTDKEFQKWAAPQSPTEDYARLVILHTCRIDSRRELDCSDAAHGRWDTMLAQFRTNMGQTAEQRG